MHKYLVLFSCLLFFSCRVEVQSTLTDQDFNKYKNQITWALNDCKIGEVDGLIETYEIPRSLVNELCREIFFQELISTSTDNVDRDNILRVYCEISEEEVQEMLRTAVQMLQENKRFDRVLYLSHRYVQQVDKLAVKTAQAYQIEATLNVKANEKPEVIFQQMINQGQDFQKALTYAEQEDLGLNSKQLAAGLLVVEHMTYWKCANRLDYAKRAGVVFDLINRYNLDSAKIVEVLLQGGVVIDPIFHYRLKTQYSQ